MINPNLTCEEVVSLLRRQISIEGMLSSTYSRIRTEQLTNEIKELKDKLYVGD